MVDPPTNSRIGPLQFESDGSVMSGARFRRFAPLVALTVALVLPATAGAEAPGSGVPDDAQAPVSQEFRTDTPTLGEIFNGFTVGALRSGGVRIGKRRSSLRSPPMIRFTTSRC